MATRWCSLFRNRKFKPQRQRSIDVETAMEHERQPENPAIPSKTTAQGLSFVIGFDEPAKKTTRAPKRRHTRPQVSEASLEEKQRLAEERRKKHIEDRLERIHQREQEALSIAQSVDPLLAALGKQKPNAQMRNHAVQAVKTVVALNEQVQNDLERAS